MRLLNPKWANGLHNDNNQSNNSVGGSEVIIIVKVPR